MPDPKKEADTKAQTTVKTIQVDEILPAPSSGRESKHEGSHQAKNHRPKMGQQKEQQEPKEDPFSDIASSLGWKAKLTLQLTQWFLFLRSKSWGKWVIGPIVILGVALVILLAIPAMLALICFSILRSLTQPQRPQ